MCHYDNDGDYDDDDDDDDDSYEDDFDDHDHDSQMSKKNDIYIIHLNLIKRMIRKSLIKSNEDDSDDGEKIDIIIIYCKIDGYSNQ